MALQLAMLGAQFAYSAGKSYLKNQQKQRHYSEQKRLAKSSNNQKRWSQLTSWQQSAQRTQAANQNAVDAFLATVAQGKEQLNYNAEYFRDVYQQRQLQMEEVMNQLAFKDQSDEIQLAKKSGLAAASGRSGASARRLDRQGIVQLGLNRATMARELTGRIDAFDLSNEMLQKKVAHENYLVGARTSVAPQLGQMPGLPTLSKMPYIQKPSSTDMWMEIGQAGLNAGLGMASHMGQQARHKQLLNALG